MESASLPLCLLLFVCCIALTYQATFDSERTKRSWNQRALDVRESSDEIDDREERASKGCGFSCPAGEKMVQNDTNTPRANGCGPYGIKLSFVDDAAEDCCKAHDYCYEICGKSRLDCDVMLRDCIQGLRKKRSTRIKRGWHGVMGSVFYRTVRTFGCKAYTRGQTRGCMCIEDEHYDPNAIAVQDAGENQPQKQGTFSIFSGFH